MKKAYCAPTIDKITFDYRTQIVASVKECFGSVINVSVGVEECVSGTPMYFGWDLKNPGQI